MRLSENRRCCLPGVSDTSAMAEVVAAPTQPRHCRADVCAQGWRIGTRTFALPPSSGLDVLGSVLPKSERTGALGAGSHRPEGVAERQWWVRRLDGEDGSETPASRPTTETAAPWRSSHRVGPLPLGPIVFERVIVATRCATPRRVGAPAPPHRSPSRVGISPVSGTQSESAERQISRAGRWPAGPSSRSRAGGPSTNARGRSVRCSGEPWRARGGIAWDGACDRRWTPQSMTSARATSTAGSMQRSGCGRGGGPASAAWNALVSSRP